MVYALEVSSQKSERERTWRREEESDKSREATCVALSNAQQTSANNMCG